MSFKNLSSTGANVLSSVMQSYFYTSTSPFSSPESIFTVEMDVGRSSVEGVTSIGVSALSTGTWTINSSNQTLSPEECQFKLDKFKSEQGMVFDHASLVRVLISWTVFLLSAIGNCFVLTSVTIKRRRRAISNSQLMMMHLTIANLMFTVFIISVDTIWQTTKEWYGGDFLCRFASVLRQFAMYSSSAMVVVMGIDRAVNLMCPMSLPGQRRRILTMLSMAWTFCALNAIPAGVIFSLFKKEIEYCPDHYILQCVDLKVQGKTESLAAYYVYTMLISFFAPLVCILVCYVFIAVAISRMARVSKEAQKRCLKQRQSGKSVTRRGLDRARRVSLIVTGLITFTFIICWGPYYITGLIEWFGRQHMSPTARFLMIMSMYLNPVLHPLITVWLMKEIRDNVLMQCRRNNRGSSQMSRGKMKQPIVVKMENNGAPPENGNGSAGTKQRSWL